MQFSQKFLEHTRFRWIVIRLAVSIFLLFLLVAAAYGLSIFVQESQELNEYYKRTHSHVYDRSKEEESACYGCKCSDVMDQLVCLHCQCDNGTHIVADTPEQTFERCLTHMLLKVCPSVAIDTTALGGMFCRKVISMGLRAILLGQEHLLNVCVNLLSMLMLFVYAYFYPYSYYHQWLEEDKTLVLAEEVKASTIQAQTKYNNVELKELKKKQK